MKIYDISWPISAAMTTYKNKPNSGIELLKQFEQDGVRESQLTLNAHSGTHVDAPSHFCKDGISLEKMPLASLIGPCKVLDLTHVSDCITREHLESFAIDAGERILCKTANSAVSATASFDYNFIYVRADAAQYLAQKKITALGIDYLGIERNQPAHETHITLFNAGIAVIEGLRLQEIAAGDYFLCCLPLAVQATEAAPARAILMEM